MHICTFTLLLLSGERNFCISLNQKFNSKLPADLPLFTGTHVDLLIIVLHKLGTVSVVVCLGGTRGIFPYTLISFHKLHKGTGCP